VTGSGFAASSTITAKFDGAAVTLSGGTTNTFGTISATGATFTVPNDSTGQKTVTITDASSNTASANYIVSVSGVEGLIIANHTGGTAGKPETGDTITVTFGSALKVSTLCSSWSGDTTTHTLSDLTVTFSKGTAHTNDMVTYADPSCPSANFGSVDLGTTGGAFSGGQTLIFGASTVTYTFNSTTGVSTLAVALGNVTSGSASIDTGSVTATWSGIGIQSTSGATLSPSSASQSAEIF
jgi:hypothetical protein